VSILWIGVLAMSFFPMARIRILAHRRLRRGRRKYPGKVEAVQAVALRVRQNRRYPRQWHPHVIDVIIDLRIAARRGRVPSRWEQTFWACFDAQRATLERAA
jgi:hypothetical protein